MQTDFKMRVLTTIVSFLCLTITLWGADTLHNSPYKNVSLSKQSLKSFHNIAANAVHVYHYSNLKASLGYAFGKQTLSDDIGNLDNFSSSPRLCDAGNILVSKTLFSQIETINVQFTLLQVPSALESPSSVELAIPPPGDCPLLEALAKDLADPEKGPALNAFLDEFFTPNSVRVKAWEGLVDWEVLRTNLLDLGTVSNYFTRTNRTLAQFKVELFSDLPSIRNWLNDQASNVFRFTEKQLNDFVTFSTKQSSLPKVMLGKYDNGSASGYIAKAGNSHTYFDMGNKWDEAKNLVIGGSNNWADEMWEINKKFLKDQKNQGKEFWLSHDPFSPGNDEFFAREVNWLIDNNVQNFQQIGGLWKAVW